MRRRDRRQDGSTETLKARTMRLSCKQIEELRPATAPPEVSPEVSPEVVPPEPLPVGGSDDALQAAFEPKTVFVDWADLETSMQRRQVRSLDPASSDRRSARRPRLITSVHDEAGKVRANVRDSARAVLTWVSALLDHEGLTDLDAVLDRCLRPGPDPASLNYAALAREIGAATGIDLSPKRVRTAIEQLRKARQKQVQHMPRQSNRQRLETLHSLLEANFQDLVGSETPDRENLRRSIAVDVLAAVRRAAGRVIENDFGEGIPPTIDVDELEGRFLDFVRGIVRDEPGSDHQRTLPADLHRLLVTLCDYDGSSENDVRLVVDGGRVVADLMGPDSLPGIMAQLNVLVAGRHLLDSELYCAEMSRLAEAAAGLRDDPQVRRFLNWVRRLPEDQRLPSPLRVSSYCLNNAATHVLQRIFTDELADGKAYLARADEWIEEMRRRDSGFRLIKTTEVLYLVVVAHLAGDARKIESHFARLGNSRSLALLQDLAKYDNCEEMVRAARRHAVAALPELRHQLIHFG